MRIIIIFFSLLLVAVCKYHVTLEVANYNVCTETCTQRNTKIVHGGEYGDIWTARQAIAWFFENHNCSYLTGNIVADHLALVFVDRNVNVCCNKKDCSPEFTVFVQGEPPYRTNTL